MAHLNWRETALKQEIQPHPGRESRLVLTLTAELVGGLLERIEEAFSESAELRVDLPQAWVIFWKIREGESRLLLAHPAPEEWVATLALERSHAELVIARLRGLGPGESLALGEAAAETGILSSVSNVEIVIERV